MATEKTTTKSSSPELTPEVAERLDDTWSIAYNARTKDDLRRLYAEWAETYDVDHEEVGFFGHRLTATVLARHLTRRDVARVLDAGAGTGAAGEALYELGFRDLHALDLSPEMLDVARKKGIYAELGVADISLPVDKYRADSFDAAVLVGVFSYGQAPAEALEEIIRMVRPGGVVAFTMRADFYEEDAMGVRSRMDHLEKTGAWTLIERTEERPYLPAKDPHALFRVWCYRVTGEAEAEAEVEDGFEEAARDAFNTDGEVVRFDHAWIWDSVASRLYERYTRTDEYYLTDCEEEILVNHAKEIWNDESLLVELGCGSARKISHVLKVCAQASDTPVRYVPIDVSHGALESTEREVRRRFQDQVRVEPRQGMFEDVLSGIPAQPRKLLLFLGSSIGNFESVQETVEFLKRLCGRMGDKDRLIVGVDLDKDPAVLDAAYNREESCRGFFVHMLRRINQALGADFDPRVFELASTYVEEPPYRGVRTRRVNLRVSPTRDQRSYVRELEREVVIEAGDAVQVGVSRKFEPEQIDALAALGSFGVERRWLDSKGWFSLNELVPMRD